MVLHRIAGWRNSAAPDGIDLRWLLAVLIFLLAVLQYRLWFAEGSLAEKSRLEQQVQELSIINEQLEARNAVLERNVLDLEAGERAVEQHAREELGLVREGETYYQVVPPKQEGNQ